MKKDYENNEHLITLLEESNSRLKKDNEEMVSELFELRSALKKAEDVLGTYRELEGAHLYFKNLARE